MPALDSSAKTPFKPDAPCENQDPPNLAANPGPPPTQMSAPSSMPTSGTAAEMLNDSVETLEALGLAAQADDGDDRKRARQLEADAYEQVQDYYENYGGE